MENQFALLSTVTALEPIDIFIPDVLKPSDARLFQVAKFPKSEQLFVFDTDNETSTVIPTDVIKIMEDTEVFEPYEIIDILTFLYDKLNGDLSLNDIAKTISNLTKHPTFGSPDYLMSKLKNEYTDLLYDIFT